MAEAPAKTPAPTPGTTAALVIGGLGLLFVIGYFVVAMEPAEPKPRRSRR